MSTHTTPAAAPAAATATPPTWEGMARAGGLLLMLASGALGLLVLLLALQPQSTVAGFLVIASTCVLVGAGFGAFTALREALRLHETASR